MLELTVDFEVAEVPRESETSVLALPFLSSAALELMQLVQVFFLSKEEEYYSVFVGIVLLLEALVLVQIVVSWYAGDNVLLAVGGVPLFLIGMVGVETSVKIFSPFILLAMPALACYLVCLATESLFSGSLIKEIAALFNYFASNSFLQAVFLVLAGLSFVKVYTIYIWIKILMGGVPANFIETFLGFISGFPPYITLEFLLDFLYMGVEETRRKMETGAIIYSSVIFDQVI